MVLTGDQLLQRAQEIRRTAGGSLPMMTGNEVMFCDILETLSALMVQLDRIEEGFMKHRSNQWAEQHVDHEGKVYPSNRLGGADQSTS